MNNTLPKLILTTGEPAGVGPDLVLIAAQQSWGAHLLAVGDEQLLAARAKTLGLEVLLTRYSTTDTAAPHQAGRLPVVHIPLTAPCTAGATDPLNASYVLAQLDLAVSFCQSGECAGMVTAPVHKAVINEGGIPFSGHTEYLASATGADHVVMLLASNDLRVALATTHLPLRDVPEQLNSAMLRKTLQTLHNVLLNRFGITAPRITVLGLNPHAGEGGYLGTEDQKIIAPVCEALRAEGLTITGPVPADSAFIPDMRSQTDAYLAMYHDQGLPVLKAFGFHGAVNITLGLPLIRTSVDHGTALDLAGTGTADAGSLQAAIQSAIDLSATSVE
jgi:4-hydroxythreonine-4-phosphate dehydrogenase